MAFYNTQNERNFRVVDPIFRLNHEVEELRLQLNSCNVDIGLNCCATGNRGPFNLPNEGTIAIGCEAANSTIFPDGEGYQEEDAIAIGHQAGQFSQESLAIAIGAYAGQYNQLTRSIAIGAEAGYSGQQDRSVAVGRWAGQYNQGTGTDDSGYSTALGPYAGNSDQRTYAVAVGANAGYEQQQAYATAVGPQAGDFSQGTGCVAVGRRAGYTNQGQYSIAIGSFAGNNNQAENSIILNASGVDLNASNSGFYVKPIRQDLDYNVVPLVYAPGTNEILQLNSTSSDGQVLRIVMLPFNEIGQAATTNITSSYVNIFSYSYTPVCPTSRIIVEYCTKYNFPGALNDNCVSRIQVNGSDISQGIQNASENGAGRTSSLFPLMGSYTNGDLSAKTITASAVRTSGDDTLTVYGDIGTWLKITEIFRLD